MSFFGKNIRKIRSVKTLSQQSFAELFDLKRGTLGAYEEGRSEPKIETIIKIANYFSIPIDDLLTKELTVNKLLKFKGNLTTNHKDLNKEVLASVPCITQKNSQDYIAFYDKNPFVNTMPCLQLPINPEKTFRGYTVENLEMSKNDKGLFPKDVVIGEYVPNKVFKKLNNGILVLVLFENQLILRRLYITSQEMVLRADHKNVEEIAIPLKKIKELWRIRYVFYHRIPDFQDGIEEKLQFLEQEFAKIKSSL
ncbi:helix-turn-helix transcriptional regulator [uncultured Marixanthomonas sp.]|uniref:helix-turn-helix domain-containing protein n=1 Tax=uncultured Marixanthomonas sp. TaxID=757245 RepID=UPI0030D9ABAB|tara:strand:+ start:100161 stop:100916 length:756 start_codon:yes stop_codon:yes gene_type:complete